MRKFLVVLLVVALVAVSLAGCAPQTPSPGASGSGAKAEYGGTLRLTLPNTPPGVFNPAFSAAVVDNTIIYRTYANLVRADTVGNIEPFIAREWSYSADGLTLTFKLRDDVYFHDGAKLTAHDVEFTFKLLAHPDYTGPSAHQVKYLQGYDEFRNGATTDFAGIKVINDYEIAFTTKAVNVKQLNDRALFGILPKHILGNEPVATLSNHPFNNAPIGAGPYKFKTMVTDQYIVLEANEEFFEGRPYVDEVIYAIRDTEASLAELELNELDYVMVAPENQELISEWEHVKLANIGTTAFAFLSFNLQDPRFDQLTRQAFAHAINRQGIVDDVMHGITAVIDSPISPVSWVYHDGLYHYDYSTDKALKLLADAGWVKGADGILARGEQKLEVDFSVPAGQPWVNVATIITQNLDAIGAKVNMKVLDLPVWIQQILSRSKPYTAGQYDLGLMQLGLGADPDFTAMFHTTGGYNFGGYYDTESDALLELGLTKTDLAERKAVYMEWQEHMNEQLPVVPLYFGATVVAINTRLQNVMDKNNLPQRHELWWIPKDLQ